MRTRSSLLLALLLLSVSPALAQELEPRAVKPVHVDHPIGGNGASETWDGRVFVVTRNISNTVGWVTFVLRPERITKDAAGVPSFADAFSDGVALELDGTPNTGMGDHNAVALCKAPGVEPNPYRSSPDTETYEAILVTQHYDATGQGTPALIGQRHVKIVVKDPKTRDARVDSATMTDGFVEYRTVTNDPIRGIEPTLTADGRLLVYQGQPKNDGSIDAIMYSYNANPGATTGWSRPRSICDMSSEGATMVDGIRLDERFPIGKKPIRASDGSLFAAGELLHGAYPWISHDGTELFFAATIAGTPNVDQARRGAISVVGRWTGNQVRPIDGPINPNRTKSVRLFTSSPGAKPGFWAPYPELKNANPLPYTAARPVFPLFGSNTGDYNEISFEDFADQDYVVALRMNEVVNKAGDYDPTHTPDTSGNDNIGYLSGARFPQEYDGADELRGAVGQAIYFGDSDAVNVRASSTLEVGRNMSASLFVKRLVDLDQDGENRFRYLVRQPNAWSVILEENGQIQVRLRSGGQLRSSGPLGAPLAIGEWTAVAFTYDGGSGTLRTYVRGEKVGETSFGPGDIDRSGLDLIVGPGGQVPAAPFIGARDPVVMLDDLFVSRIVRTDSEIAHAAYRDVPRLTLAPAPALPRGLDAADLRVGAGAASSADQIELGKMLFFDQRLSGPRTVSCATCHDPQRAFTDGKEKAQGASGATLKRNTPTIVNRAFGSLQFLDGRAATLEDQALVPIQNPDEMAGDLGTVVGILGQIPDYQQRFQRAFGGGPNPASIAAAIAAFERSVLSGDSAADRFEAGDGNALGPSEQRGRVLFHGKARCSACHTGSNFSDESFHATQQTTGDAGREAVTGRRRFRGAFKTATLRDIGLTGPYLHDGSAATLEEVIDRYDRGGNTSDGRDPEIRPLGLTPGEKADLAAYLRSLSGTSVNVAPPSLPPDPSGLPAPTPPPPPSTPAPAPATSSDTLPHDGQLQANQQLTSGDGRYKLIMQGDGNLVIYDGSNAAIWSSGTAGEGPSFVAMQGDGNLVVYRLSDGAATWNSKTAGKGAGHLVMQNDGNLVIYRDSDNAVIWASNTAH